MKKRSIWIWALPIAATLLVAWYYVGPHKKDRGNEMVKVTCQPFQINQGWGYDIVAENRKVIHQDRLPGRPGRRPFSSQEDAMKVGKLVIEKLKSGIFPPAVTHEELKNLGIVTE